MKNFLIVCIVVLIGASSALAQKNAPPITENYWYKSYMAELDKSESGAQHLGLAIKAVAPGVESRVAFALLAEIISRGQLSESQLHFLQEHLKEKTALKGEHLQLGQELVAFARLDESDRFATCNNTAHTKEVGALMGLAKKLMSNNLNNYLTFVGLRKKEQQQQGGNITGNGISGYAANGAVPEQCRDLLVRVYGGSNKDLRETFQYGDKAIEGVIRGGGSQAQ